MRGAMFALMGAVYLTVLGIVGCSQESPGDDGAAMGRVSLPLVTSSSNASYRLSDATFMIDGPTPTSLSSSNDPAEIELTASLAAGSYSVVLEPGWALERDDGSGFVEVSATLLSGNPHSFTIQPSTVTALTYQFETNGTVVGTGEGQLDIDIQVDDSAAPICTPFGSGCPSGSWCAEGIMPGAPAASPSVRWRRAEVVATTQTAASTRFAFPTRAARLFRSLPFPFSCAPSFAPPRIL